MKAGYIGQEIVMDALKPGCCAGDVAKLYEKNITDVGYGDWALYGPCHGIGLMEGEAPWIETYSTWTLKENMTFCVDIFLENNAKKIGLRIEDVIRVTNNARKCLQIIIEL